MRVLFTAGGSPGNELIYRKLSLLHELWFADADIDRISNIIPNNKKIKIPLVNYKKYYQRLLKVCVLNKIEILVPGIDEELLEVVRVFKPIKGIKIFLPSKVFVQNMLDKFESMKILENLKLPVPHTLKLEKSNKTNIFPVILKPRWGRGSRGIQIVNELKELELYKEIKKLNNEKYIFQFFASGQEYTIQIINHEDYKKTLVVPLKVLLKKGVTLTAEIDFDENVMDVCKKVAKQFKEKNIFNIQLIKCNKDNLIHIFEINPRFSTTTCILPSLGIDPFNYDLSKIEQFDLLKYQGFKLNRTLINDMSKT